MDWTQFDLQGGFTRVNNFGMFVIGFTQLLGELPKFQDNHNQPLPNLVILSMLVFVVVHLAWKKGVLQKSVNGKPARAVWVEADVAEKALTTPSSLLGWAQKRNVNQVWLSTWPFFKPGAIKTWSDLDKFCSAAKAANISVYLYSLESPHFILPAFHQSALDTVDAIYGLIGQVDAAHRPIGILTDIEPQQLTQIGFWAANANLVDPAKNPVPKLFWPTEDEAAKNEFKNATAILTAFRDLVVGTKTMSGLVNKCQDNNKNLGQYVNLCLSVPLWWVDKSDTNKAPTNSLNGQWFSDTLLQAGTDVAVMDYFAKDQAVEHDDASIWISKATDAGQFAWIGLDAQVGDGAIAYSDSASLETQINKLSAAFADELGFATMAVFDANAYILEP